MPKLNKFNMNRRIFIALAAVVVFGVYIFSRYDDKFGIFGEGYATNTVSDILSGPVGGPVSPPVGVPDGGLVGGTGDPMTLAGVIEPTTRNLPQGSAALQEVIAIKSGGPPPLTNLSTFA
jgi:hypothetical protein